MSCMQGKIYSNSWRKALEYAVHSAQTDAETRAACNILAEQVDGMIQPQGVGLGSWIGIRDSSMRLGGATVCMTLSLGACRPPKRLVLVLVPQIAAARCYKGHSHICTAVSLVSFLSLSYLQAPGSPHSLHL